MAMSAVVLLCAFVVFVHSAAIPKGSCRMDLLGLVIADGWKYVDRYGCYSCVCNDSLLNCTDNVCETRRQVDNTCKGPDGQVYTNGQTIKDADGCNYCTCHNGMLACTDMACTGCYDAIAGVWRDQGSMFLSADGCNNCACTNSNIVCTLRACIGGK